MISKLDVSDGRAGFLLANGALNASADEYQIRKEIIERDFVEAIIVLHRDMFYNISNLNIIYNSGQIHYESAV